MGSPEAPAIRRRHLIQMSACVIAACMATPAAAGEAVAAPASDDGIGTVWWVELVSSNSGPAIDYYKSTLAWGTRASASSENDGTAPAGSAYTIFEAGGTEVAGAVVAQKSDPAKSRPLWLVYFRVEDVEKAIGRALSAGGKLLQAPYDVPGAARMAVLSDLDGTPFGVAAPLRA